MAEAWKGVAPQHPGLDAMPGLKAALDGLPSLDAAVLQHAAHWVSVRFEEENAAVPKWVSTICYCAWTRHCRPMAVIVWRP